MPIFRCDYIVVGDMVLDQDSPLELVTKSGITCTFRNGKIDPQGQTSGLLAIVV